jgi:hypothetical protein
MKNHSEVMKYYSISADFVDFTGMIIDKKTHAEGFNGKKNETETMMII